MTKTKRELAKSLARCSSLTAKDAEAVIGLLTNLMGLHFINGGRKIALHTFGSFNIRIRRPFVSRHPKTGAIIIHPRKRSIAFKPSPQLVKLLNEVNL
jgi:nucleoid DNA-binding protein